MDGQGGRENSREDTRLRSEQEDNFISFEGGEFHQERSGKEGTQAAWFCQH